MPEADGSVALTILDYDHDRDWEALKRIYFEVGWLDDEDDAKAFEPLAKRYDGVVFPLDGAAECAVFMAPGAMRHLEQDVDMAVVAGVTTSRVARKLGAAKRLTAHSVAKYADAGAEIAALGMFEQGFYDRLGFGTGSYQNRIQFDPATLTVEDAFRPPKRMERLRGRLRGHTRRGVRGGNRPLADSADAQRLGRGVHAPVAGCAQRVELDADGRHCRGRGLVASAGPIVEAAAAALGVGLLT